MKSKYLFSILAGRATRTLLLLSLAGLVAGASMAADAPVSDLLEKGIYSEESKGDLDGAMKLYEQVVSESKTGQAVAAQAQYRLGVCYYKKKDFSHATEAFDKLLKDYPDQKDWVNRAREYLVGAAALAPAPWADGEELTLDIKFPTGFKLGTAIYTVKSGELEGHKTWRVGSRMFAGVQSFSRVEVDSESLKPLRSRWKHTLIGDVEATYTDSHAELKTAGKEGNKQIDLDGVIYDNEEAVQLMRRLPLEANYKTSLRFLSSLAGTVVPVKLEVSGPEKVTVTAGNFDCYKVELNIRQTFWYSADAHRYLVKFEANGVVAELAAINQRKVGEPVSYQDSARSFSITAPPDWAFCGIDKPDKGSAAVLILDPDATGLCSLKVLSLEKLKPAERKSARDWAQQLIADHSDEKDFKVRADSWKERAVSGHAGVSFIADYVEGKEKKIVYAVCAFDEANAAYLDLTTSTTEFGSLKPKFDGIVDSYNSNK